MVASEEGKALNQSSPDTVDLADLLLTLSDVEQSFGRDYNAKIMREAEAALRAQAATSQARIEALETLLRSCRRAMEHSQERYRAFTDWSYMIAAIDRIALAPEQDK